MNKAIFLDRDGTINEEVNYLKRTEDINILPNTAEALQKFKDLGFLNIIITNQSGIARGFLNEDELNAIHDEFKKIINTETRVLIDDIFYSPYHTDGIIKKYTIESEDRKPGTGMILKARSKHNIDLGQSFFIGDSYADMKAAENAGIKKILVRTGYGKNAYDKCAEERIILDYFADDLLDASGFVESFIKKNHIKN